MIRLSREMSNQTRGSTKSDGSGEEVDETRDVRRASGDSQSLSPSGESHQELSDTQDQHQLESRQQSSELQCDNNKPKRNPFCSRCRNHGKSAQVKGHKRHCEYRDCQCEGCKLVECRQIVSAAQIKRRRYQKQDEESGRRIEISPPVLTRASDSDPAALIAKKLIGSSTRPTVPPTVQKAFHSILPPATMQVSPVQSLTNQRQPYLHHQPLQPPDPVVTESSRPVATVIDQHQPQQYHQLGFNFNPSTDHHYQNHHPNEQHSLANAGSDPRSPTGSTLSNVFHLFHFPDTVISAAATASLNNHQLNETSASYVESASTASRLTREASNLGANINLNLNAQLNLVEEIYRLFGPMAIFAWLKTEHFNSEKIRAIIELFRPAYQDLLEARSKCMLDKNFRIPSGNNYRICETITSSSNGNVGVGNGSGSGSTSSVNSSRRSSSNSNIEPQDQETHSRDQSAAAGPTTLSSDNSLIYGTNYSSSLGSSSMSKDSHNLMQAAANTAPTITTSSCGPSLGHSHLSPYHSLTNPTQPNLLWPGLKLMQSSGMSSSATNGAQMMNPHHLIPHFMHHQHLLAQQAANVCAANNKQQ